MIFARSVARPKLHKYITLTQGGDSAPVVYLGGSITWGASASPRETMCWRGLLSAWMIATYENNYHINSGVSSTPSWYGLIRLQTDVIDYGPALVIIDFAVNDWYGEAHQAAPEALVRRLRTSLPNATLLFVVMLEVNDVTENDPTNIKATQADWWHQICRHYDIPCVDFARQVARKVAAGGTIATYINTDNIHPINAGHQLIFEMLQAQLSPLDTPDPTAQWSGDLTDYPPLHGRALDYMQTPTNTAASTSSVRTGTWTVSGGRITSTEANATATWTVNCSSFGFDARLGTTYPPGGVIQYQVDGGSWVTSDWTAAADYENYWPLWWGASASHEITVKVVSGTVSIEKFLAV